MVCLWLLMLYSADLRRYVMLRDYSTDINNDEDAVNSGRDIYLPVIVDGQKDITNKTILRDMFREYVEFVGEDVAETRVKVSNFT